MKLYLHNRRDVYRLLNDETIWYRQGMAKEVGHSVLYLPCCAILRREPDTNVESVRELIEEFATLYGLKGVSRSVMPTGQDHLEIVEAMRKMHPERRHLLFEGYEISSERENAEEHRKLAHRARQIGYTVTISSGQTVDVWNTKPHFRNRVVEILGHGAVPPGVHLESPQDVEVISRAVRGLFKNGAERVVVKTIGSGGRGNTIITCREDIISASEKVLVRLLTAEEKWLSVETWIPWQTTGCCSFFLVDGCAPIHMTLVEQVLSPTLSGFIGSCSLLSIGLADQEAIIEYAARIVDQALTEGVRGFCGVDFIVSLPGQSTDELLLPSGLALRFVEATPRIGANNQELKALSMIAARERATIDDFAHVRICNEPIPDSISRSDVRAHFMRILYDFAEPLTDRVVSNDKVYFLLDCNFGQDALTPYDAIMLVCRRGHAEPKLRAAYNHLQSLGLLQT